MERNLYYTKVIILYKSHLNKQTYIKQHITFINRNMNTVISKFPYLSYSEALNLKNELYQKDIKKMKEMKEMKEKETISNKNTNKNINIKLEKRPSILFSIIQGPKLYA